MTAPALAETPSFDPIPNVSVAVGQPLSLAVTATVIQGDVRLSVQSTDLRGSEFQDYADGSGELLFTADDTHQGDYPVTLSARHLQTADIATTTATVTVLNPNARPYLITAPGGYVVDTGSELRFEVTARDDGGDPVQVFGQDLPSGATVSSGSGTGEFSWTPTEDQAGEHTVVLGVSDGVLTNTASVTITVYGGEGNYGPPVFLPIAGQRLIEGEHIVVRLQAYDVQTQQSVTLSAEGLPDFATFESTPGNPAMGSLTWFVPLGASQDSPYDFVFVATDDGVPPLSSTVTVQFAIIVENSRPEIVPVPPFSISECMPFSFVVEADDPDGDTVTVHPMDLEKLKGARFDPASNTFSWECPVPGNYLLSFVAVDDGMPPMSSSIDVSISVQRPVCDDSCGGERGCNCRSSPPVRARATTGWLFLLLLFARRRFRS